MRHAASTVMAAAVVSSLALAQPADPPPEQSASPQLGEKMSHMISRPKTPTEYARNLKFVFDHNMLLRQEFFAETNLKDVFNLDTVKTAGEPDHVSVVANLPPAIFPLRRVPEFFGGLAPSAQLVGGRNIHEQGVITAGINFSMDEGGPDFTETQKIFGVAFHLLDPLPSPHGGPAMATDPHGNETWRYITVEGETEKNITLGFNPAGRLSNIILDFRKNTK